MLKSTHQLRVEDFMNRAKQEVPTEPTVPDAASRELRAKLILEEALETVEALGFDATVQDGKMSLAPNAAGPDLVGIIDGCCDIKVVTTGTLSSCGLPDELFQKEVDENNLSKFAPGHSFREDGKLIKPPNFTGPKIKEMLAELTAATAEK